MIVSPASEVSDISFGSNDENMSFIITPTLEQILAVRGGGPTWT